MPLLDVVLGYDCNLKCTYCTITDSMRMRSTPTARIASEIDRAALLGWKRIAFTGGEPTIFENLPRLVRHARERGFDEIKIASNGLRYAHEPYLDHLVASGANLFHISMHAHEDSAYERTVQRAETARLRRSAIESLVLRKLPLVADLIVKRDTVDSLRAWIADLAALGVRRFRLWLVSLTDNNAANVEQLPALSSIVPVITGAFDDARASGLEVLSLHIPRCLLSGYEEHVQHPGADDVRVVTPDDVFDLRDSRLTGGVKPVEVCGTCRYERQCPGLREDYVARFGTRELSPVRSSGPETA